MKPVFRLLAAFAFASCVVPALAAQPAPPRADLAPPELTLQDVQPWLDGLMPYAISKGDIAGAVVVVVKDGKVLFSKGYGYADVAARTPVNPELTMFRIGSVSKLSTWTAVMQLVEQGKIDLDADVNRYLDFTIPAREGQPITMRNMMTHSTGFEDTGKNLILAAPQKVVDNEAWLKAGLPARIFPAGKVSAYSNYAVALAGYIVQRVSGQPFDDYIEQHLFQPLGMAHSTFRQPLPDKFKGNMALGYMRASEPPRPYELVSPAPAGSMATTGADMARFMIAHLQLGQLGGQRILQPETARRMHTFEHLPAPMQQPMALGFFRRDRNGQTIIEHAGDTELFHSDLSLLTAQQVGVFISMSGAGKDNAASGLRLALIRGFVDRYFPAASKPEPTLATARAHGAMLVGRYVLSRGSASSFLSMPAMFTEPSIRMEADGTLVTPDSKDLSGQPRRWREVAPFVWRDVDGPSRLSAQTRDGAIEWLSVDESSSVTVLMPAPWWRSAAWNMPVLYLSLLVLLATVIAWPVSALFRRRHKVGLGFEPADARWYHLSRLAALVHLLFVGAWVAVIIRLTDSVANLSDGLDAFIRVNQVLGLCAIVGAGFAAVNAYRAWRLPRRRWHRFNSTVLLLALLAMIWFAFSLNLMTLHMRY